MRLARIAVCLAGLIAAVAFTQHLDAGRVAHARATGLPGDDMQGSAPAVRVTSETFGDVAARAIGPAAMSGRIAAVTGWAADRLTIYAGAAGGGLWKSVDGGVRFAPVFDNYSQSIGAIAVDPGNPRTVWVGTGESWTRNSVSVGDGVYRSTDGGDSFTKVGLAESERIARIVVDPGKGSTVFVCALGHLFDDSEQRGVFRTTDAGKTWEKVLYLAPDTGCGDLAMDPHDPSILYAGMWEVRRRPDFFTSGGPHGGFFRSKDGGSSWEQMTAGLPEGETGRIAIAVAPSKPELVYATVESKRTALFRSDDRGSTWTEVNASPTVGVRPFYFSRLVVDPADPKRIYKMGQTLALSQDGGKSFMMLGASSGTDLGYHADVHDAWINPAHPADIVIATDGGLYISHDRGNGWLFVGSLPVSQFYHVSYDMQWPYQGAEKVTPGDRQIDPDVLPCARRSDEEAACEVTTSRPGSCSVTYRLRSESPRTIRCAWCVCW